MRGNGASQQLDEHPWGAESHTLAKLLRPRAIGNLFGDDGGAHGHDLVDEAAMQALAVGGKPAFSGRLTPPGGKIPLALFPLQTLLPMTLDAPALIEVLRVVGAALAVHLALQTPDGLGIGGQLGAEELARVGCLLAARWQAWRAPGPAQSVSLPTACLGFWEGTPSSASCTK